MKLTTGVKWGLVAGLVVGVLDGVLAYMSVCLYSTPLWGQDMVKMGTPPAQARQAAEFTRQIVPPSAFAGGIIVNVIIYLIMGLVMAAVWERLPWYAKGALFGVVLTALLSLPSLLSPPPPDVPTPPAVYGYASTALNFAGPILLAWLLNRAASRA
jgi:hypothetical protein